MPKRRPVLRAVRPSTIGLVLCGALVVGVPAAAAVLDPATGRSVPAAGAPLRTIGRLADALPSGTAPTASTIAGSAPTGGVNATALPFIVTTAKPGSAAEKAIAFALAQRGLPYVWGGDGPQNGDAGFDCSGLTKAAYGAAGIDLPRTAHTQFYAGPHVPDGAPLEPGDLVFYGVPARVHHVGLYIGGGRMVNAPDFGKPVQIAYVRYPGDDYIGATRPAAGKDAMGLVATSQLPVKVPPTPSPAVPPGPSTFPAPPAPDPAPDTVLGEATPQALKASPTLPDTPPAVGTPEPSTAVTPPGSSVATVASAVAPTATGLPMSTAAVPTTVPPTTPAPVTTAPTTTPAPPTTTAAPTTTPPPASTTTAPATTTPPVTTTAPPPPAPAVAPTALALPGADVTLMAAEPGPDGLPPAPASATSGTRLWRAGTGGAGTAAVRVADAYDAAGLTVGSAVVATGPGDTRHALKVTSRRTLTAAQAKAAATALGTGYRVVVLQVVPATGQVLVIVAA